MPATTPASSARSAAFDAAQDALEAALGTSGHTREHLLIGSDICFWGSMVKPLFDVVQRALEGGAKRFVIADPGRPTFYELAERCRKQSWQVTLREWYAVEPSRTTGEVLEVRP